jgi:hypothetical protein
LGETLCYPKNSSNVIGIDEDNNYLYTAIGELKADKAHKGDKIMRSAMFWCIFFLTTLNLFGQDMPFLNFDFRQKHLQEEQIETLKSFFTDNEVVKRENVIVILTYFTYRDSGSFRKRHLDRVLAIKEVLVECGIKENRIFYRFSNSKDLILKKFDRVKLNGFFFNNIAEGAPQA